MLSLLFAALLSGYTAFVLLDTFVIPRVYTEVPDPSAQPVPAASGDGSAQPSVTVTRLNAYDSDIYVADIVLPDPSLLRTALANGEYGRNITAPTSQMAQSCQALIAINGDYYGSRNSGYVIRDGVLYRSRSAGSSQEDLAIMSDGSFLLFFEGDCTAEDILAQGAQQVFSFGPGLVSGGEILVDAQTEVSKSMSSNPRTAIAMIAPGHYLFVVSDGRTDSSRGLTLWEMAELLCSLGAQEAYNLDGGGSSTMVYQGEIINFPTTNGRRMSERAVSDIVYIQE